MSLNDLRDEAYETAKSKGWHDKPATVGDRIALMHSELSEALEAFRTDGMREWYEDSSGNIIDDDCVEPTDKLCGLPSELADVIIRIMDFCGAHNIDIDRVVKDKMAYNKLRPYRHGNKSL